MNWQNAASLIAAWTTGFSRTVGGASARLRLIRPTRSMASSAFQAGLGSMGVPKPTAVPPRYAVTEGVVKIVPGIP